MPRLRRHQLLRLHDAAWPAVRAQAATDAARDCIDHWARHRLPLVVTRQASVAAVAGAGPAGIAVGLPAPARWQRLRLGLVVPEAAIRGVEAFPAGERVTGLLPAPVRPAWHALLAALATTGAAVRVHGSYGWQVLTGLDDHVRAGSDLDLCVDTRDAAHADAVVVRLAAFGAALRDADAPRLDGELVSGDGSAVAWREWHDWRAGHVAQILVRDLHGVALHRHWPALERAA